VYVFGAKIKQSFLEYKLLFKKMEYLGTFMKNKTSLFVIYTEINPAPIMQKIKLEGGNKGLH
jgi:hypothetical protein